MIKFKQTKRNGFLNTFKYKNSNIYLFYNIYFVFYQIAMEFG